MVVYIVCYGGSQAHYFVFETKTNYSVLYFLIARYGGNQTKLIGLEQKQTIMNHPYHYDNVVTTGKERERAIL